MPRSVAITRFVVGAIAFGVVVAVVKGQDAGVRDALGNLSAPWVLVPFLAGSRRFSGFTWQKRRSSIWGPTPGMSI